MAEQLLTLEGALAIQAAFKEKDTSDDSHKESLSYAERAVDEAWERNR